MVVVTVTEGVLAVLEFDILGGLEFTTGKADVERDVVGPFVQFVAWQDLRSWAIIFPSSPQVSIWPFVGWSSNAICLS